VKSVTIRKETQHCLEGNPTAGGRLGEKKMALAV
jgi:hypothetical protein